MNKTGTAGDHAPTVEYIRYSIRDDTTDAFLSAYRAASVSLDASPECLGYELSQCVEEPEKFILRIHWTSVDDHMRTFRASNHFRDFFACIRTYVSQIEEMHHYSVRMTG